MQAQALRTETTQDVLTAQQSLQSVQTLLKAGLGCITYLRNLLPSDNFSESYLTSANTSSFSSQPSESMGSFSSDCSRRNVSGFKIMTVTRGYTEEADKLLDFLENGIFDALQNQYLKSFIFAIYLDNDDPNNIVEAYTFNFQYFTVPGTKAVIPVMTLGEDLMNLSLSGKKSDPVADATKKGKVPTLGEVKRSLKTLIKNLIQATTQMDALPKRRFATFKLFYHEHTPEDYEPPHFRAGDVDKDKWFFATHDQNEVPEKCSVGQVQTGWHGVDVNVTSVSGYLPSVEDNDAPFLGTTQKYGNSGLHLTPVEEAATRAQQVQAQKMDADSRRVVWDAEGGLSVPNSESEIDQDKSTLGQPIRTGSESVAPNPLGIRTDKGEIIPLPTELVGGKDTPTEAIAEAHYVGAEIHVPKCVGDLANSSPPSEEIPETQQIAETQLVAEITSPPRRSPSLSPAPSLTPTPQPRRPSHRMSTRSRISSLPPSDIDVLSIPSVSSYPDQQTMGTQALQDLLTAENRDDIDEVMLNTETQIGTAEDPIQSFPSIKTMSAANATDSGDDIMSADVVECECGVTVDDCDCILCEGGCKKWFHIWCMGYHAADDKNMPAAFTCFDCRIRADQHWELIMVHNLHPRMMERFRDLALFRRAIKVYEKHNPNGLSAFSKLIGCESLVAGQLFKRLEGEGFIEQEVMQTEEFLETTTRKTRGKGKGAKPKQATRGKSFQKSRYSFQYSMKSGEKYREYFTPTPEVERKVLGLADLKPDRKSRHKRSADIDMDVEMDLSKGQPMDEESQDSILPADTQPEESQTQDETQRLPTPTHTQMEATTKRKNTPPGTTRAAKKVKISVGPAVDLGD